MSTPQGAKKEYEHASALYDLIPGVPAGVLESQLIKHALGDATGLTVLDLGGGSGLHAREAVDAGAKFVDIVDISPDMMQQARNAEVALGRENEARVRFFEADVSQPLDHVTLSEKQYDIAMANWVFDHAGSEEILEGMWRNIAAYLKPGGLFLGIRIAHLFAGAEHTEKYGVTLKDFKELPGGAVFTVRIHGDNPFEFEAASTEASYSGSTRMHEKYGLKNVQTVPYEVAAVLAEDRSFWDMFLQKPFFAVTTGVKEQ